MKTSTNNQPKKPRAADVAAWVAVLARPIPDYFGGGALADARSKRAHAMKKLSSYGLDSNGQPKVKAVTS